LIFLSLGTHEQPFGRALALADVGRRPGEELLVQHGLTPPDRGIEATWCDYMTYEAVVAAIQEARAFVCHAGIGSILTALGCGVTPIVIPRLARFGEHVDDHQLQIAAKLAERRIVVVLKDGDDVGVAIAEAAGLKGTPRGPGPTLRAAVRLATERRGRLFATSDDRRRQSDRRRRSRAEATERRREERRRSER
jgi:UDP-N-acetylglucosamine transferase subunit ALG13